MKDQEKKLYLTRIGNRIKQLRLKKNMSQESLAKLCGYTSRSSINKIELGNNDVPQSKIQAISKALGVSVSEILCGDSFEQQYNALIVEKDKDKPDLDKLIEEKYGSTTISAISLYVQLDNEDKGEIRGEMKQMLKAEKYSIQKTSSGKKAM